ncbi:MAG: sigma-54-dependent Fis family transcriptional regulator [Sulfuricella sp.]|nr:sigma-54-dependent Fis family transcriptional regulator [Sulfuricella sp.]
MTNSKPTLLIVDDDPLIADTLGFVLARDFAILTAQTREQAIAVVRAAPHAPQLALVDLGLPPTPHRPDEGFQLIGELLAHSPAINILVLSGQNDQANSRHARTLGAVEFIAKPCEPERIKAMLLDALRLNPGTAPVAQGEDNCGILGGSLAIRKLRQQIRQYADTPYPVLIEGESGSGKELVAACLHHLSARRDQPNLAMNCAAIAPSLVEPTLFGHAKGAFTGAGGMRAGYFEEAGAGTLFLDEIGELPLELQAKLLRVLENGEYCRVGETATRKSRARIVAATNRDLRSEIRKGNFRADLYHRLSVFAVTTPPLRELGDDKLLLLEHFRALYAAQNHTPPFDLDAAAQARWLAYPFPGNARELRNIVIRLTAKHSGAHVTPELLEVEFDTSELESNTNGGPPENFAALVAFARSRMLAQHGFSLDHTLRQWENAFVQAALNLAHGNHSQAAKLLGVQRTTLYSRIQALHKAEETPLPTNRNGDLK